MKNRPLLPTIAVLCALLAPAFPADAAWRVLGVIKVDKGLDRDEVDVKSGRGFKHIKLKADAADVELKSLHVVYANGELDKLEVRKVVRAGDEGPAHRGGPRAGLEDREAGRRSRPGSEQRGGEEQREPPKPEPGNSSQHRIPPLSRKRAVQ